MNRKSLNGNKVRLAQAATGISPADYPLRSLESRAAARALLDRVDRMNPPMPEYDQDALTIYRSTFWLDARMSPNYSDVETTAIYERGLELAGTYRSENSDGNERVTEMPQEFVGFEIPADFHELSTDQLNRLMGVHLVTFVCCRLPELRQAWIRRLRDLTFPIRVEGTTFLYRTWKAEWEEDAEHSAALQQFATGIPL